jgi:hypothetical protein
MANDRTHQMNPAMCSFAEKSTAVSSNMFASLDPFFEQTGPSPMGSSINDGSRNWGGTSDHSQSHMRGQSAAGQYELNQPFVALLHEISSDLGKRNKRASSSSANATPYTGVGGGRVDWCKVLASVDEVQQSLLTALMESLFIQTNQKPK